VIIHIEYAITVNLAGVSALLKDGCGGLLDRGNRVVCGPEGALLEHPDVEVGLT
jgi:hypothetical protein